MGQKYFRMEIRSLGPRLVRKQDVDKEGRLEPEMETGRVDWPVGSRFFDRPLKPVEIPSSIKEELYSILKFQAV